MNQYIEELKKHPNFEEATKSRQWGDIEYLSNFIEQAIDYGFRPTDYYTEEKETKGILNLELDQTHYEKFGYDSEGQENFHYLSFSIGQGIGSEWSFMVFYCIDNYDGHIKVINNFSQVKTLHMALEDLSLLENGNLQKCYY